MIDNFTPEIIKTTALKIEMLRAEQNISLRELSKKAGVSKSQLYDIVSGNKTPNIYTLYLICNALNASLSDLFHSNEEVLRLRGKEALLIKIFRAISPMSQDTLIKVSKCMK